LAPVDGVLIYQETGPRSRKRRMYDISYAAAGGSFEREQEDSLNKKIPHRWEERQGI